MKKLIAIILMIALACTALTALAAELTDVTCKEMQFTTKAPAGTVAGYTEDTGLRIYTKGEGGIPYVQVFRRPLEYKFSNPQDYLNNVVREYLEDKYGKDSQGMNPAKEMEIGGKTLLGARYYYVLQGTKVTQINVIEIRDAGDVEYTAKFYEGYEDITMETLETAVQYYQETDTAAATVEEPKQATGKTVEPMDLSWLTVNKEDGQYSVKITDTDKVDAGGYFTAEIYFADTYPIEEVYALQEGDKVTVNGTVYTVDALLPEQDGARELRVKEEFDGYIVFKKATDNYLTLLINDWVPSTKIGTEKVMLPLPNAFAFFWAGGDDEVKTYDWESFVNLLRSGELNGELKQYNTLIQFKDGLVMSIGHTDYPEGPAPMIEAGWAGE